MNLIKINDFLTTAWSRDLIKGTQFVVANEPMKNRAFCW